MNQVVNKGFQMSPLMQGRGLKPVTVAGMLRMFRRPLCRGVD